MLELLSPNDVLKLMIVSDRLDGDIFLVKDFPTDTYASNILFFFVKTVPHFRDRAVNHLKTIISQYSDRCYRRCSESSRFVSLSTKNNSRELTTSE